MINNILEKGMGENMNKKFRIVEQEDYGYEFNRYAIQHKIRSWHRLFGIIDGFQWTYFCTDPGKLSFATIAECKNWICGKNWIQKSYGPIQPEDIEVIKAWKSPVKIKRVI